MDRGNIGKDSLKLTISQMSSLLIGMISAMLLSRFRTLGEYGTYSQIYIIAEIVAPLAMLGIPASISYFLTRGTTDLDKRQFLYMNLLSTTVLGVLTGIIILVMKPFLINYFSNPMLGKIILIIALFPWARTVFNSITSILIVYNKTTWLIFYKVSHSLLILIAVAITLILQLDFYVYMIMFIVIEAVFALIVYFIASYVSGGFVMNFNSKLMLNMLKYSIPIGLSSTLGSINKNIDKLIIGRFFSTENLAIYTNAARELPLNLVGISIASALLPRIILLIKEKRKGKAIELWGESIKLSYIFMCFFTVALIVYAPEIISILYSPKYLPGVTVFRIYSLILILNVTTFNIIINSMGKTKYIFYSTLLSIGANIVISLALYSLLGFVGPAIATLISFAIFALFQLGATVRLTGSEFKVIFPWKSMGYISVVNIAFGAIFFLLGRYIKLDLLLGQIAESIIFGVLWLLIYFGIYFKYLKKKWDILNRGSIGYNQEINKEFQ